MFWFELITSFSCFFYHWFILISFKLIPSWKMRWTKFFAQSFLVFVVTIIFQKPQWPVSVLSQPFGYQYQALSYNTSEKKKENWSKSEIWLNYLNNSFVNSKIQILAGQIGHRVTNGSPPLRHFFESSCVTRRRNGTVTRCTLRCQLFFQVQIKIIMKDFILIWTWKESWFI